MTARQSLVAFCWEVIGFNGGKRAFGNRLPPAWEWPEIDQRKFLRAAYRRIDKALVAAHLAMPVLLGRDTLGERGVAGREARIEQAINAEALQREASQKAGYAVPPVRLPVGSDKGSKVASRNVLSRVMRPVRPVLHLAAGLGGAAGGT